VLVDLRYTLIGKSWARMTTSDVTLSSEPKLQVTALQPPNTPMTP